jgi:hypothetical protein
MARMLESSASIEIASPFFSIGKMFAMIQICQKGRNLASIIFIYFLCLQARLRRVYLEYAY